MQNRLHPYDNPIGAAEMDPRVVLADGGELDEENEEEEYPEELVLIDESDDARRPSHCLCFSTTQAI
jgi:hypothetical protein